MTPPTARVAGFVSPMPRTKAATSSTNECASVEKPNSLGSCPTMMTMPSPFMYPTWTSFDSRSATKPSLATPSPISIAPTNRASIPARAIEVAGSPDAAATGTIAA